MTCYAVTRTRNKQSEQWRGLSRCYAVTAIAKCVRGCAREEGQGKQCFSYRRGA
jgi:hypothetical protein